MINVNNLVKGCLFSSFDNHNHRDKIIFGGKQQNLDKQKL